MAAVMHVFVRALLGRARYSGQVVHSHDYRRPGRTQHTARNLIVWLQTCGMPHSARHRACAEARAAMQTGACARVGCCTGLDCDAFNSAYADKHVIVVGIGNSALDISLELAMGGAKR